MRPARVLFVAWGHSIHAERRIGLFLNDPQFEVAVVSTYPYRFPGAVNVELTAARTAPLVTTAAGTAPPAEAAPAPAPAVSPLKSAYRKLTALPVVGEPLHEAVTSARDLAILRKTVASFRPDVVFLQTLMYPSYLALALPRRIPQLITFWNGDVVWWAKHRGAEKLFKKRIVTAGVRRAAAVTVNSEAARGACLGYGADPSRLHVIRYPGVDLTAFESLDREGARRRLGFTGPVVVSQRGPAAYQNLETLVDAAPAVLAAHPGAVFVFLSPGRGHGPEVFAHLRARAEALGVAGAMRWVGNVSQAETRDYLAAADAAVTISSEDSLPNSMLEAMAARVPVVAGDIPPIREWVTDGETGFMAEPKAAPAVAAAIKAALTPGPARDAVVAGAFARVRERASTQTQVPILKKLVLSIAGL